MRLYVFEIHNQYYSSIYTCDNTIIQLTTHKQISCAMHVTSSCKKYITLSKYFTISNLHSTNLVWLYWSGRFEIFKSNMKLREICIIILFLVAINQVVNQSSVICSFSIKFITFFVWIRCGWKWRFIFCIVQKCKSTLTS